MIELQPRLADLHYQLGLAQAGTGAQQAALTSWEKVLELNPEHLNARLALARLALTRGDLDAALDAATAIQKQHPTSSVGRVLEGDIRSHEGSNELALAAYRAAQEVEPQSAVTAKIAASYRRLGDFDAALATLPSWLDNHPDDHPIRVALASSYQSAGEMDKALKHYNLSLRTNNDNAVVLNNVAWIYHGKNDPKALETAKRAYELVPGRPEIADTYGWFLVQEGRVEKGLSLLARAVDQAPQNYDIRYHWAAGLALAGDKTEAREELEKLLSDERPFAERAAAQELLEKLE